MDKIKYIVKSQEELKDLEDAMEKFFQNYAIKLMVGELNVTRGIENTVRIEPSEFGRIESVVFFAQENNKKEHKGFIFSDKERVILEIGENQYNITYESDYFKKKK